jgi:hypothetical protein
MLTRSQINIEWRTYALTSTRGHSRGESRLVEQLIYLQRAGKAADKYRTNNNDNLLDTACILNRLLCYIAML